MEVKGVKGVMALPVMQAVVAQALTEQRHDMRLGLSITRLTARTG
jgi:hypothetical protein